MTKSAVNDGVPEQSESAPATSFPIWRTLRIGGKLKDDLIVEIEARGMKIEDFACDMMRQEAFTTFPESIELQLVRVTVAELGFPKGATTQEIWNRALGLKLQLCPAEVGPYLRLADAAQAPGKWYWIAMEPITDADDYPLVFKVGHDDYGRWLLSRDALPVGHWFAGDRLVFVAAGK